MYPLRGRELIIRKKMLSEIYKMHTFILQKIGKTKYIENGIKFSPSPTLTQLQIRIHNQSKFKAHKIHTHKFITQI